jgi:hypothetical protein
VNGLALVPSRVTRVGSSGSSHPDEDILESYVMNKLTPADDEAVSLHLLVCEQCQIGCSEAEEFVAVLREVLPNKSREAS